MRKAQKCITIDSDVARAVEARSGGNFSAEVERLLRVGLEKDKKIDDAVATRMSGVVTEVIKAIR